MNPTLGLEFLVRLSDHFLSSVADRLGGNRAKRVAVGFNAIGTTLHDVR